MCEEIFDEQNIRKELTTAFRFADKYQNDSQLNSIVQLDVYLARDHLRSALENLSLTQKDIDQRKIEEERRSKEEEREFKEQQEKEYQEEQEDFYHAVDEIITMLDGNQTPKELSHQQVRAITNALLECLPMRPLSDKESCVISSILKDFI